MKILALIHALVSAALLSTTALAGDYYVDAVAGNNSNGGSSPGDAWKTVTRALVSTGYGDTIFIAPGLYDTALGESFPMELVSKRHLIGSGTAEETVIDAGGANLLFIQETYWSGSETRIESLSLQNAGKGLQLFTGSTATSLRLRLTDVIFSSMSEVAIQLQAYALFQDTDLDLIIDRCTIQNCFVAVSASGSEYEDVRSYYSIQCNNSLIVNNTHGFSLGTSGPAGAGGSGGLTLLDSRVDGTSETAVSVFYAGCTAQRSVFAANGTAFAASGDYGGIGIRNCSLVDNGIGVECSWGYLNLHNSILWDNTNDVVGSQVTASYTNFSGAPFFGGPPFVGSNGNISVNPRFWAQGIRDYHLKASSACIDAGDPTSPLDPDNSIADMGAFVFDPEYAPETVNYCMGGLNSVGKRAQISATGSTSLTSNDFTLSVIDCPLNKIGLFYYGPQRVDLPFGDGTRCIGSGGVGLFRLAPPLVLDGSGMASRLVDFGSHPTNGGAGAILAGSKWNFQFWYRDPAGPLGSGFNLSNALTSWFLL